MKVIFAFLILSASVAQAYPQIDPSVRTPAECAGKGGDWNAKTRRCTIYVSDGSDNEGAPLVMAAFGAEGSEQFQDGCYNMSTTISGGVNDAGVICLSGLYDEGVGQNLRIVTANSGRVHFCGESHSFRIAPNQLSIAVEQPIMGIQLSGTPTSGQIRIGAQTLSYRFLPNFSAARFFSQCR